jgi:hypothetical protein
MFMSNSAQEMADRHSRMLADLAELTLTAARDLQVRLVKAETPSEAAELGLAFQRVSRSLRQTLLLEGKLAREHRAGDREEAAAAQKAREAGLRERKDRLRSAVTREIAEACESLEEAEDFATSLEQMLDGYVLDPEFADASLDELAEVICQDLGLPALADEPDAAEGPDEIDAAEPQDEAPLEDAPSEVAAAPDGPAAPPEPEPPEPEPQAPPVGQAPPPEPCWHPSTGQRIIRDPDHGGWRVIGDSS